MPGESRYGRSVEELTVEESNAELSLLVGVLPCLLELLDLSLEEGRSVGVGLELLATTHQLVVDGRLILNCPQHLAGRRTSGVHGCGIGGLVGWEEGT